MEKQFVDLLSEELKLQEAVDKEHAHHMNITFVEARRLATEYQKEAEKCIATTETCEVGRERAVVLYAKEMKLTNLWERRARQAGWKDWMQKWSFHHTSSNFVVRYVALC